MKYYNNPLNIRTGCSWAGLVQFPSQERFCEFHDLGWCVRAWIRILRSYQARFELTIPNIVSAYAPSSDGNNVASYCNFLYRGRTTDPFSELVFQPYFKFAENRPLELYVLCRRMCQMESNFDLSMKDFDEGYSLRNAFGV